MSEDDSGQQEGTSTINQELTVLESLVQPRYDADTGERQRTTRSGIQEAAEAINVVRAQLGVIDGASFRMDSLVSGEAKAAAGDFSDRLIKSKDQRLASDELKKLDRSILKMNSSKVEKLKAKRDRIRLDLETRGQFFEARIENEDNFNPHAIVHYQKMAFAWAAQAASLESSILASLELGGKGVDNIPNSFDSYYSQIGSDSKDGDKLIEKALSGEFMAGEVPKASLAKYMTMAIDRIDQMSKYGVAPVEAPEGLNAAEEMVFGKMMDGFEANMVTRHIQFITVDSGEDYDNSHGANSDSKAKASELRSRYGFNKVMGPLMDYYVVKCMQAYPHMVSEVQFGTGEADRYLGMDLRVGFHPPYDRMVEGGDLDLDELSISDGGREFAGVAVDIKSESIGSEHSRETTRWKSRFNDPNRNLDLARSTGVYLQGYELTLPGLDHLLPEDYFGSEVRSQDALDQGRPTAGIHGVSRYAITLLNIFSDKHYPIDGFQDMYLRNAMDEMYFGRGYRYPVAGGRVPRGESIRELMSSRPVWDRGDGEAVTRGDLLDSIGSFLR